MAVPILKETPITTREAFIPYTMTAVNMLAPTLAARDVVSPLVLLVAMGFILLGLPCSIYFRQRQYNRILLNLLITAPLLVLTWLLVRNHPGMQIDWSDPINAMMNTQFGDQLEALLNIFVVTAAGRAFLLVTAKELVQTPIPSIGIFLLTVVRRQIFEVGSPHHYLVDNLAMVLCLLLLLATSLYLFSHDHSQQWFSIQTPTRIQRRLVAIAFIISLALFPLIFISGIALREFNMYALARMNRERYPRIGFSSWFRQNLGISIAETVDIGPGGWPEGNQIVMTVQLDKSAPQNLLWREGTYARYERGSWRLEGSPFPYRRDPRSAQPGSFPPGFVPPERTITHTVGTIEGIPTLTVNPKGPASDPGIVQGIAERLITLNDPKILIDQRFSIQVPLTGNEAPFYGGYQITTLKVDNRALLDQAVVGRDGSLKIPVSWEPTQLEPYSVTSIIKPLPTTFRLAKRVTLSDTVHKRYLSMPGGSRYTDGHDGPYAGRMREKALEILAAHGLTEKSDQMDIVRQFEFYLGLNYIYSLNPKSPPHGVDPLIDFLYTQKKGYCTYFAGAMVMLCRSIGLPARFVVGFATGDAPDMDATDVENDTKVIYTVRAKHAHSWVEVFLPRYGWYTSDPTANSREVPTRWSTFTGLISNMWQIITTSVSSWFTYLRQTPRARALLNLGLAILLVLIAGIVWWRQERPPKLPAQPLSPDDARKHVIRSYQRMHRWLRMWGVLKPDGLTAGEFDRLFHALNPPMGSLVSELSALYIRAQYGHIPLGDADARQAVFILRQLWEVARKERKHLHREES
ncbi:MAG: DUF4129 domain-containing transglutaminase family protein [Armatimonadota bacterium]